MSSPEAACFRLDSFLRRSSRVCRYSSSSRESFSSGASGGMGRIWDYLERVDTLLPRGRAAVAANRAALDKAARETGVDAVAIAGIWGNETSYGNVLGNFYIVEALASLAYEGRRRAFFEDELHAALTLLQDGLVTREELTGSYAGALGQVQFMPSNILALGRDGDGDGERDLRGSLNDAFLSCGNYLRHHGWRPGEPWLAEARLPGGFRWELAGPDIVKTAAEWDELGVRTVGGYVDFIIERNSVIPIEQTRMFTTASDNQRYVRIQVCQGESARFEDNTKLGEILLTGLREAPRGGVTVAVTFEINTDGLLEVRALDQDTGQEQVATMRVLGGLPQEEVEAIVARARDGGVMSL